MQSCKQCYHNGICNKQMALGMETLIETEMYNCKNFKDKSQIIEPPYEIGSVVWVIDDIDSCSGYIFLGCNKDYAFLGNGINGSFDINDICQYGFEEFQDYEPSAYIVPLNKVYFAKEAAEQALKGINKNENT